MTPEPYLSRPLTLVAFSKLFSKAHGGLWDLKQSIFQGNRQISWKCMQISIKIQYTPYQWMNTHGFQVALTCVYDIDLGSMATIKYCRNVWTSPMPQETRSVISIFFHNKLILDLQNVISWSTRQPRKNIFKGRVPQHGFYSSIFLNPGPDHSYTVCFLRLILFCRIIKNTCVFDSRFSKTMVFTCVIFRKWRQPHIKPLLFLPKPSHAELAKLLFP